MILFVKKFSIITPFLLLCALYIFIFYIFDWFSDMFQEAQFGGIYSRKLRSALVCGFTFFLISEIMLFGGFFWAFFDRVFNPGYITGGICLPSGIENVDFYR
jgi:cytochrome c oxidase subunit 3